MAENTNAGTVHISAKLDTSQYQKSLKNLKNQTSATAVSIKSVFAGIGKQLAKTFAVGAMIKFGAQCIELGSDLEEVQNVVDTVFPNMSGQVEKFSKDAIKNFGLSEKMAKQYVGTFGSMAEAFGFTEAESYKMASALTGLTGDVASFYNLDQETAYTKLKSVFSGETESLKELGIVMTQSALDSYAMANGFGKTTSAMTEQEKVSLRLAFVTQNLSNANGDFAKTANGWANQVRVLSLQWESFKASLGQSFIAVLNPVLQGINILMAKLVSAGNTIKSFFYGLVGKQADEMPKAPVDTAIALDSVADNADASTKALKNTTKQAKALSRTVAGFDKITKLDKKQKSGSDGGSVNAGGITAGASAPVADTTKKVGVSVGKFNNLGKSLQNLKKAFEPIVKIFKEIGGGIWKKVLVPLGKWTFNKLLPKMINIIAKALKAVSKIITAVYKIAKPIISWIYDHVVKRVFKYLGEGIMGILDFIESLFDGLNSILEHIPSVDEIVEALGNLKEAFAKKAKDAWEAFKSAWNSAKTTLTTALESFADKAKSKWNAFKTKWNSVKTTLKTSLESFADKAKSKWNAFKTKWNSVKTNLGIGLASFADKAKEAWKAFKNKWNDVKNNLSFGLKKPSIEWDYKTDIGKLESNAWKLVGLSGRPIPKLSWLAQGGYVKKNTPQLAMIGDNKHQGEVVAPESKLEELARNAIAGANTNAGSAEMIRLLSEILIVLRSLDLTAQIDGNSVANLVVNVVNNKTRSTGKTPFLI